MNQYEYLKTATATAKRNGLDVFKVDKKTCMLDMTRIKNNGILSEYSDLIKDAIIKQHSTITCDYVYVIANIDNFTDIIGSVYIKNIYAYGQDGKQKYICKDIAALDIALRHRDTIWDQEYKIDYSIKEKYYRDNTCKDVEIAC